MPFGLTNAPAVFQQFINEVLGNLLEVCTIGYLDDILIYSDSVEEHCLHVWEILQRLHKASLFANLKKCTFHTNMVEFVLSPDGLKMDPSKVSTIQAWLVPHNIQDIQSFLGFTNFYHCFIDNYSNITHPLTNLCRKAIPWHFDTAESTAFSQLKEAFTTASVICHWLLDLPMTLETDTSDHAIAGILSVTTPNQGIFPVAFHS